MMTSLITTLMTSLVEQYYVHVGMVLVCKRKVVRKTVCRQWYDSQYSCVHMSAWEMSVCTYQCMIEWVCYVCRCC